MPLERIVAVLVAEAHQELPVPGKVDGDPLEVMVPVGAQASKASAAARAARPSRPRALICGRP